MKKSFRLLGILLILVLNSFCFAGMMVHTANATYVEGAITKDTIWTLVDSPFVVSGDIIIYPNATLTIEPSVEVRFGGNFSMTVEGKLSALGTVDKIVKFTSNKIEPQTGDWKTINFIGTQLSSLTNCAVEYAADGIFVNNGNVEIDTSTITQAQHDGVYVENGDLTIQNSNISLCHENGVNIDTSTVTIQDSQITENSISGITITGNNQITIQRNLIIANGDGIVLKGNVTSGVDINDNVIAANSENGVLFAAEAHSNVVLNNNEISSNRNGLHISTSTYTYVTNNAFSYNEIGIVYDQGTHTAYFNDIYGNTKGMDASINCTINAQQNYWGDPSGPYHKTLNPTGRGNEVGGDGTNLVFIFFLTQPIGHINERPIARLVTDRILVPSNDPVMFFGTGSTDEGQVDRYFFDFADGGNSGWITLSVFTHEYATVGLYDAKVTVMDDFGATSDAATATINVTNLSPLHAYLDLSKSTVNEGDQVAATVYVTDGTNAVTNAGVTIFAAREGDFSAVSGSTDATGHFISNIAIRDVIDVTNVRVIARASMNGYTDGADHEYLEVLPLLSVQITPDSSSIKSEGSTGIIVEVRSNDQPVANAYLTISADDGNLSENSGTTDLYGRFSLNLTAPLTTQPLNITITASARKEKYVDGMGHGIVIVEPKVLEVTIEAHPDALLSEAGANITVHITYEGSPIESANVTLAVLNGTLSQTTGLTNIDGIFKFVFTAPPVKEQTTAIIMANASATGYADSQEQIALTVNPKTFRIKVDVDPDTIESELLATVIVNVTCVEDGRPVQDALVLISSDDGSFVVANKTTAADGLCSFVFATPQTSAQLNVTIFAGVSRNGYVSNGNQTVVTVIPKIIPPPTPGFPLLTVLLIVIPIVIVVVALILIKMKIIAVSVRDEEE